MQLDKPRQNHKTGEQETIQLGKNTMWLKETIYFELTDIGSLSLSKGIIWNTNSVELLNKARHYRWFCT